jgi:hypothetical protein
VLKICLMRKSLLSLVADAYAGPSDACVWWLWLVCYAPHLCCVLRCVSCSCHYTYTEIDFLSRFYVPDSIVTFITATIFFWNFSGLCAVSDVCIRGISAIGQKVWQISFSIWNRAFK